MRQKLISRVLTLAVALVLTVGLISTSLAQVGSRRDRGLEPPRGKSEEVVLVITGVIGPGAYRQFRSAIRRSNPKLIILDGPGGILGEALMIGQEVRRRGLSTLVAANGQCASACAVVYLSGRTRYVGKNAAVGLHAASDLSGRMDSKATTIMANYLGSVGVPSSILKRMAATKPSEIRWLTRAEQKALKLRAYP